MCTKYVFTVIISAIAILGVASSGYCGQSWLEKGKQAFEQITTQDSGQQLNTETIDAGLKEALKVGTSNVVTQLGQHGGFLDNPKIRIPLGNDEP